MSFVPSLACFLAGQGALCGSASQKLLSASDFWSLVQNETDEAQAHCPASEKSNS